MKKLMTGLAVATFATLLGVAPAAQAQSDRENSTFTVTEPIAVGSFTLPPGTYLIKIVMLTANREVVQVTDVDQTKVFANVLATPHFVRPGDSSTSSRYVYYAAVPGQPRALRTWFARNAENGHDIVYSKSHAMEIAVAAKEPVIAVPDEVKEAEYEKAELVVVTPEKQVKAYEPPTVVAEARPEKALPKTASNVPLLAALGLLSLGAAFGVGVLANRT